MRHKVVVLRSGSWADVREVESIGDYSAAPPVLTQANSLVSIKRTQHDDLHHYQITCQEVSHKVRLPYSLLPR